MSEKKENNKADSDHKNSKLPKEAKKISHNAQKTEMGPNPVIVFLVVLSFIVLISIFFAAIKVFFFEDSLMGHENIIYENGSINITFCRQSSCEDVMLQEISDSRTAECAFYELDLPRTISILAQKNASVIVYDDNDYAAIQAQGLLQERLKHVASKGLMHDKFCVLDKGTENARVITGSMNPTTNDDTKNDNNLLVIRSATLARRYDKEFSEIAARKSSSYEKNPSLPAYVRIQNVVIEQRFCPQESCENAVVHEIASANKSIEFMAFSFTSDDIGQALIDAHNRNVSVSGVFEKRQVDQWSELYKLQGFNIDAITDKNPATMHHKVFIIDNETVITGSFNPTANANTKNDENLLIIHDKEIAAEYTNEFNRVYEISKG